MAQLPIPQLRTHAQRICSLYKRVIRNYESWYPKRDVFRYHAVLVRAQFDANKNMTDMVQANKLLLDGEEDLQTYMHPDPRRFASSPGGIAYGREAPPNDWVLDYWHPLEKAQYPEYFKRREERKKEYIAWWNKEYGGQEAHLKNFRDQEPHCKPSGH